MSAAVWEQYDASRTERLWSEADDALEQLSTSIDGASTPETMVLAEQITHMMLNCSPQIEDDRLVCSCGTQGEHEGFSEHLAYVIAEAISDHRENVEADLYNAEKRLREAVECLMPDRWSWTDTVRGMGR